MFAAVCVLLASLGHVLMSGTAVPWWSVAVAFAAAGAAAWWLAERERGPLLVTAMTVGTQTALHALFSLGQAADGGMTGEMADMPGMEMRGHAHQAVVTLPMSAHHGGGAVGMLTAHLVAALLTGLWLSAGEQAVFRLGRAVAARLFAPVLLLLRPVCPPHRPPLRPRRAHDARRLRQLLLVHAITSRGPPAGAVAV
ncbi:hypothetical protein ACIQGZ_20610 [Streptomyces sp. NPDC092296]|uniref:hypothetical protein n=1 Tax=Streptomyces sp. NPDC092296 TaxID=3366012 RepID=UPI0037F97907